MLYNSLKIRAPRYVIDNCTSVQRTATVTPAFTIHWKLPMKETFFNAIYIYMKEKEMKTFSSPRNPITINSFRIFTVM